MDKKVILKNSFCQDFTVEGIKEPDCTYIELKFKGDWFSYYRFKLYKDEIDEFCELLQEKKKEIWKS